MKVAVYMASGGMQIILTPETPWERSVVDYVKPSDSDEGRFVDVQLRRGEFRECRGGWVREYQGKADLIVQLLPKGEEHDPLSSFTYSEPMP